MCTRSFRTSGTGRKRGLAGSAIRGLLHLGRKLLIGDKHMTTSNWQTSPSVARYHSSVHQTRCQPSPGLVPDRTHHRAPSLPRRQRAQSGAARRPDPPRRRQRQRGNRSISNRSIADGCLLGDIRRTDAVGELESECPAKQSRVLLTVRACLHAVALL